MYSFYTNRGFVFTQIENLCKEKVNPNEIVYFTYFSVRVGEQDKSWVPPLSVFKLRGRTQHVV